MEISDHRGALGSETIGALAHLGFGRAYAMQGDMVKARAAYNDFLTLKCVWAAPFVAHSKGRMEVTACGLHHDIHVDLDRISQKSRISHILPQAIAGCFLCDTCASSW